MTAFPGKGFPHQRLLSILLFNLFILLVFLWTTLDTLTIDVEVAGSQLTGTINGYEVTTQDTSYLSGGSALWLKDERSYRNYVPPPAAPGLLDRLLISLWTWDLASNPSSGWRNVAVEGQTTQRDPFSFATNDFLKEAGWRPVPLGAYRPLEPLFAPFGNGTWMDYTLEAKLLRGKQDAGILVRSSSPGTGYLFWFRPEHGDMGWQVWEERRVVKDLAVTGFRLPLLTGIKAVLRELLWSYLQGLAIVAVVLALAIPMGALAQRAWRRLGFSGSGRQKSQSAVGTSETHPGSAQERDGPRKDVNQDSWIGWRALRGGVLDLKQIFNVVPLASVAVVCLLALGIAATIAVVLYARIPHVQDSVTYLFQAETFARGRISAPAPIAPEFFYQEFIVLKDGQWFGKYPPGFPLVLALGVLLGVPWLIGPLTGSLALGAIYLAGRTMYGSSVGLLAIVLGVLSPFFLFLAASFMAHPTELLFISLFLLGFVKVHKGGSPTWALATGLFWGLALMTRSLGAVAFGLPFALYALGSLIRRPREGLWRYGGMAIGALSPLLFLLWYNYSLTGSPLTQAYTLFWDFDRVGFGEGIGRLGPHSPEAGLMNTWRNVTILLVHLYGWLPYVSLAFVCLPFTLLKANQWDILLLGAVVFTIAAYVFYWADGIMFGPRYYYSALPALFLLTARGIQVAATVGRGTTASRARSLAQGGVVTALVGILVLGNLVMYLPGQIPLYIDFNYTSGEPLARVKEANLTNALVFVDDDPEWQWWKYGALFIGNTPWLDGEVIYARDLGREENTRLMAAYPNRKAYLFDGILVEAAE